VGWNLFTRGGIPIPHPDPSPVAFAEVNARLDRIFVRFDRLQADFIAIMEAVQQVANHQQRLDLEIARLAALAP
jgi:hypothetical protein